MVAFWCGIGDRWFDPERSRATAAIRALRGGRVVSQALPGKGAGGPDGVRHQGSSSTCTPASAAAVWSSRAGRAVRSGRGDASPDGGGLFRPDLRQPCCALLIRRNACKPGLLLCLARLPYLEDMTGCRRAQLTSAARPRQLRGRSFEPKAARVHAAPRRRCPSELSAGLRIARGWKGRRTELRKRSHGV